MRKLLMLAVMAFAALAVSAPSASATIHPDFPYGDTDPSHWFGVVASDPDTYEPCGSLGCEFSASGSAGFTTDSNQVACGVDLSGAVSDDGSVSVSNANFGGAGCQVATAGLPWQGQICFYYDQPWLKLHMGFVTANNPVTPATVFGQFEWLRWGSSSYDTLTFDGDAMWNDSPGIVDFGANLGTVAPYMYDDSGSCSWPELQA
jgi:hypothetical protein